MIQQFVPDPEKVEAAITKLPKLLIELKDPSFKDSISNMVDSYPIFITDLGLIAEMISDRSMVKSNLEIVKMNYYVLSKLLEDNIWALDNIIAQVSEYGELPHRPESEENDEIKHVA